MFPELTSQNTTLDATDFQNIQMLYQSAAHAGQGSVALRVQAMASFNVAAMSAGSSGPIGSIAASGSLPTLSSPGLGG